MSRRNWVEEGMSLYERQQQLKYQMMTLLLGRDQLS
jgi:hypothetical protein